MSSGVSGALHHAYFSTHNVLNPASHDEEKVWVVVDGIGGNRNAAFCVHQLLDIEMVKRLVIKTLGLPSSTNVSEIRLFYRGTELPNHRNLSVYVIDPEEPVHFQWVFRESSTGIGLREKGIRSPPRLQQLMSEINLALQRGTIPKLTMDGTGGTYFVSDSKGQSIALFKPTDEEAFAPNNPRGFVGKLGQKGFRSGVASGEGAQREVAAFLLDAVHFGFTGIPETTTVEARHPSFCYRNSSLGEPLWKEGSLQEFVDAPESCGDYASDQFSVGDVHRIGIFDIRVLNLDRNDGNMLVGPAVSLKNSQTLSPTPSDLTPNGKLSKYKLYPIDHGLILPDTMDVGDIDLVWYYWPHAKIPFNEIELRHIFSLNPDKDAQRLARKLEIREECLRTMRVSTRVLQIGAQMHLNLSQIASMILRSDDFDVPSIMEKAVKNALSQAYTVSGAKAAVQPGILPGSLIMDLNLGERINKQRFRYENTVTPRNKEDSESASETQKKRISTDVTVNSPKEECNLEKLSHCKRDTKTKNSFQQSELANRLFPVSLQQQRSSFGFDSDSSDDWDNSTIDSQESNNADSDHNGIAVSKFTGLPLDSRYKTPIKIKQTANKSSINSQEKGVMLDANTLQTSLAGPFPRPRGKIPSFGTSGTESKTKRKFSSFNQDITAVSTRNTTNRQRPTAIARRGTSTRATKANIKNTWTLIDSNKKVLDLNWQNPLLESTFFECFELLIRHHVLETHPDWESYPFNGDLLLRESESAAHKTRKRSAMHKARAILTSSNVETLGHSSSSTSATNAASKFFGQSNGKAEAKGRSLSQNGNSQASVIPTRAMSPDRPELFDLKVLKKGDDGDKPDDFSKRERAKSTR